MPFEKRSDFKLPQSRLARGDADLESSLSKFDSEIEAAIVSIADMVGQGPRSDGEAKEKVVESMIGATAFLDITSYLRKTSQDLGIHDEMLSFKEVHGDYLLNLVSGIADLGRKSPIHAQIIISLFSLGVSNLIRHIIRSGLIDKKKG